jgi:hypothetical protein
VNIGEYFIVAGTLVSLLVKTATGQEVSSFLTQIGVSISAGAGSVPAFRVGGVEIGPIPIGKA